MTAERWLKEKALFVAVVGLPPEERQIHLAQACAGDPGLRAGIEALLVNHAQAETDEFLSEPFLKPSDWANDEIPPFLNDFDVYDRIEYLGHGGMGVVYRAFHKKFDTRVALKMILPQHLDNPEIVRLFDTEPRNMALLKHPNIVQVHHVGQHDGQQYFTMNLIEGVSLDRCLGEFRDDPRRAAQLLVKVARAVHHAHQRRILHRDLKPANILLDRDGEPVVTDLGLAKRWGSDDPLIGEAVTQDTASRVVGGIIGTISYMSSEQATPGTDVTTVSDVYGLGAVLYALLTGRPPFQDSNIQELLRQVRDPALKPVSPRLLNRRVDPDLEAICMKCLDKNPAGRYPSAESLARDLENWLAGKETSIPGWSPPYRLWRWCKRNPILTGLATAAVLLVAAFDLTNSQARLAEREQQVLTSNAYTAQSVARTFDGRLQLWASAVLREAQDDTLRTHLIERNQAELKRQMARAQTRYAEPANGITRDNKHSPFASWFVLDGLGILLAHSDEKLIEGNDLHWRDYFRGASTKSAGSTYISRVWHSHLADEYYKFAIASPVREGEALLGVVVTTVLTDSAENVLLHPLGPQRAALVGRWDGNKPKKGEKGDLAALAARTEMHPRDQPLILLHPAFKRGHVATEIHNKKLFHFEELNERKASSRDERYHDPVSKVDARYAGRWLAASAPVEDTGFVVIVQQEYENAVQPQSIVGRPRILWGAAALGFLVCVAAMIWSASARNRERKTA